MQIADMQLKRRDYWVTVQDLDQADAPELDYRVLAFSFENNLVIDWSKAFPGPNPTDILPDLWQDENIAKLSLSHGIYRFETAGIDTKRRFSVIINTVRS
ncbi:hypothetical protein [Eupransor demetentiae]|uniref:Uncharacterized protein n=1 Tax=Eupransor demetentiae TaxID=3109584 RepID=A0ABP0ERA8_9LACO|nr:hypothetical protein R54876_GBNLAHCA_01461 [Lactobacillaceae bacterium LMG 33000]